jgi:hypothetical protein
MAAEAAGAARGGEAEAEHHPGRLPENTGETAPPPLAARGERHNHEVEKRRRKDNVVSGDDDDDY